MAMSAASKPFTVKGTRWMCTVWFVAFFWRQRGCAWVCIVSSAGIAVRMAAPAAATWRCAFLSIDAQPRGATRPSVGWSAADLPGLCGARAPLELGKPSLEPDLLTVGDAVGGPDAMGLRTKWASL